MYTAPHQQVAPNNVNLADVHPGELVFNWSSMATKCSSMHYSISSKNCGCPSTTDTTTVTCSSLELSIAKSICTFSVQSMTCGYSGSPSNPIMVTLKGMCISLPKKVQFE